MKELKAKLNDYTVKVTPLSSEDGGGFKAIYEELALSVKGYGETVADAVADLEEVALDVLDGEPLESLPAPRKEMPWVEHSGRVTLRLPKVLHAQLDRLAEEQGVSLNQLMTHALQSAATALIAGQEFGACTRANADQMAEILTSLRGYVDTWSLIDLPVRQRHLDGSYTTGSTRKPSSLTYSRLVCANA